MTPLKLEKEVPADAEQEQAKEAPGPAKTPPDARLSELAGQLQAALQPVEPTAGYINLLRLRLGEDARRARQDLLRRRGAARRRLAWTLAGIGGVFYLWSAARAGLRLSLWLIALVAGLVGWRFTRAQVSRLIR